MNRNIRQIQAEIYTLKVQRALLGFAITGAEQFRKLAIKKANAKLAEPEGPLSKPSRTWHGSCVNARSSRTSSWR